MLARAFAVVALLAAPAFADPSDCDAVRRVLSLAGRAEVDVGDLARLEARVCATAPARGETCRELDAFWMLATALERPQEELTALEAQRTVWCGRGGEPTRPLQWPGGTTLRSSSGTLTWPGGTMARTSSGAWYAPSGSLVRSSSGTLYYPSGPIARSSSGRWSLPSGELADEGRLAALACEGDLSWCRYFLGEAQQSSGVRRDFAMLGLGRLAGLAR